LDLFHWHQEFKQLNFKDCYENKKITADQKFIIKGDSNLNDNIHMFVGDEDYNAQDDDSAFSTEESHQDDPLSSINKKLMKRLWDSNGYGGDFNYLLKHHKDAVVEALKDDTILERTYNKQKFNMILPLETAVMDPRYDIWDEASDITSEDLEAMNARYPKKPRRDEYESEGMKSIFNLNFNDSYKYINMGHRQLETCCVAAQKPSLISKFASSFSSGSKMDPPTSQEVTETFRCWSRVQFGMNLLILLIQCFCKLV
jgi:hypothetical protein